MDAVMSDALEEICSQGEGRGIELKTLFNKLKTAVTSRMFILSNVDDYDDEEEEEEDDGVKQALWCNLLKIPGLQFECGDTACLFSPNDHRIQSFHNALKLNLKLLPNQNLSHSFKGLYVDEHNNLSTVQQRVLQRLASARADGITQNQLCKELGMEGRNFFYVVKNLESRGLIVRQSALIKTTQSTSHGLSKTCSNVVTNMMYLYRYAPHLDSQQRIEITNEQQQQHTLQNSLDHTNKNFLNEDDSFSSSSTHYHFKQDICIKDYSSPLKAVCHKLDGADGKVLVVSDIKRELGYAGAVSGHRAWRTVISRLKDYQYVEEFDAKVDGKVERCVRLLKSFPESDTIVSQDKVANNELEIRFGRHCPITQQIVELPIEQQVYDLVDAEGPEGLTVKEMCGQLGISNKKNYTRFSHMFRRFGMHMQAENDKKAKGYRIWTPGNYNTGRWKASTCASTNSHVRKICSDVGDADVAEPSAQPSSNFDPSILRGERTSPKNINDKEIDEESPENMNDKDISQESPKNMNDKETVTELPQESPRNKGPNNIIVCLEKPQEHKQCELALGQEIDIDNMAMETSVILSQKTPPSSKPKRTRSDLRYPCLPTADYTRREKRIVEWIKDEKFILRAELHRWLINLEKDKGTTIDRKTLDRILKDLQEQGHCKYVEIHVPAVTNCGRSRRTHVVMHPDHSVAELTGEIHDRLRSFEIQSHSQAASKCKNDDSVPILSGVQRTRECLSSDAAPIKSETMRANGFVLAKMVRTKLLHIFLWEYVNILNGGDPLSSRKQVNDSKNPHSTCCLFSLEAAIKYIPLELFLQVVGSTQKFDEMIEMCKRGLRLSDLPTDEYRRLMDTQATGRLSLIIDILRRLKLIRLVTDGQSEDVVKAPQAIFSHALELKPYIEEPSSLIATSSDRSSNDLRPRIRHDFSLSNRHAVDEYWKALEYCYATADPKAALHSFPGSAVNEVFLYRSWASVRVMSADQRAELLKRIVKDDPDKKLSYKECEEIAKDLNLTLEQVLRVYYDKRQRHLNRLSTNKGRNKQSEVQRALASQKRKRTTRKHKTDDGIEHSDDDGLNLDTFSKYMEEQNFLSPAAKGHAFNLQEPQGDEYLIDGDEPGQNKGSETCHPVNGQGASSKTNPMRQRRFSWTEETDRQLVIQYARYRAKQGAKFHRVDWCSLSGLPAPPSACQKRIASLNKNIKFRKALMRLCNILSERYVNHLQKFEEGQKRLLSNDECRLNRGSSVQDVPQRGISDVAEHTQVTYLEKEQWDDFDDKSINSAFEEVLYCKRVIKLEAPRRVATAEKWSDRYRNSNTYDELISKATPGESIYQDVEQHKDFARRSRCNRFQRKFIKLLSDNTCISRQIYESLAVSNAVELFKLVFLSTSTTPEVADLLAETLRHYSEHDLFTAFTYLREKKIMIGGTVGQPYELSQQFLHSISRSPFPANTGKRAAKFSSWLHEREKDLMGEDINLTPDLQCGDVLHLFALVSSGELSLSPCLPDEGVGEADDLRTSKRKNDYKELCDGAKAKKLRTLTESEIASRREKGFPGIMVSVSRSAISTANVIEIFKDEGTCGIELGRNHGISAALDQEIGCNSSSDHMEEILIIDNTIPMRVNSSSTSWEAMSNYAQQLISTTPNQEQANVLHPDFFRDVSAAILKAGDQGLSLNEISQVMNIPGESMAELVIDILQTFGVAFKVNAYDCIQVVAVLYRSKYFLAPKALCHQDVKDRFTSDFLDNAGDGHPEIHDRRGDRLEMEMDSHVDDVHRVTILNLPGPEGVKASLHEDKKGDALEGCSLKNDVTARGQNEPDCCSSLTGQCVPILPWINGNGTVNMFIYKGLVRRVLGIVMQNPGILQDDIIMRMDVLNPQSCRKLLQLMILENHLIIKKMYQTTTVEPPLILKSLLRERLKKTKVTSRDHFFANPRSTSIL